MAATLSVALPPGIVAWLPAAAERGVVLAATRATARRHSLCGVADLGRTDGRLPLGGPASADHVDAGRAPGEGARNWLRAEGG